VKNRGGTDACLMLHIVAVRGYLSMHIPANVLPISTERWRNVGKVRKL
jgi:hypothetical protein